MPFIKTAFLDIRGAKVPTGSSGEGLTHFGGVTLKVVGDGNLDLEILSEDETRSYEMLPLVMEEETDKQPTRLSNFMAQRAQIKISTDFIDEIFNISRIVIWTKPVYTSYPM